MNFLYTARGAYDKYYEEGGLSWERYIQWSGLTHLTELVSLDSMLNEVLVEPDRNNIADWDFIHIIDYYETGFFTTLDFIFKRLQAKDRFNLLAVVLEPEKDCKEVPLEDYEFVGYDLLDQEFSISALSNCGGFDETFTGADLNEKGLISQFEKAYDIKKRLRENNPGEDHANTNVIAVWRHKTIGRRN